MTIETLDATEAAAVFARARAGEFTILSMRRASRPANHSSPRSQYQRWGATPPRKGIFLRGRERQVTEQSGRFSARGPKTKIPPNYVRTLIYETRQQ
jgi:hypothetical protein